MRRKKVTIIKRYLHFNYLTMSDNITRNNTGMINYEAIFTSLDRSDRIFTEDQLFRHVNLTNVFSSISLTCANNVQTVFHDIQPARDDRNFAFSEICNFETVFSAAQLTTEANFTGMFTTVSVPNVIFAVQFVFTCEQITRCLRLSSLHLDTPFVHFDNVAIMVSEELFTSDSRPENEPSFTQVHITNTATVFSEDEIIGYEEIATVFSSEWS